MGMKWIGLACAFVIFAFGQTTAQVKDESTLLRVGASSPDFTLNNVEYFRKRELSLSDFRGQHLILNFWDLSCSSCIKSLHKVDSLQRKFGNQIQFFPIGRDLFTKRQTLSARDAFEKYRKHWDLRLPSAYSQSLSGQFQAPYTPYFAWIDEKGILVALTSTAEVNERNVKLFLDGKLSFDSRDTDQIEIPYDSEKPLLLAGNGGEDSVFLFRSILAERNLRSRMSAPGFITTFVNPFSGRPFHGATNMVQVNGASLGSLYMMAYGDTVLQSPASYFPNRFPTLENFYATSSYGKWWPRPLLELRDSSLFDFDPVAGIHSYAYSLCVPPDRASAALLQRAMQRDLDIYFGYHVSIQTRSMPCWNLVADSKAHKLLRTSGQKADWNVTMSEIKLMNVPVYGLIARIHQLISPTLPIIDRTGIAGHIDIELSGALLDFDGMQKELQAKGLYLERGRQEMRVIVISHRTN